MVIVDFRQILDRSFCFFQLHFGEKNICLPCFFCSRKCHWKIANLPRFSWCEASWVKVSNWVPISALIYLSDEKTASPMEKFWRIFRWILLASKVTEFDLERTHVEEKTNFTEILEVHELKQNPHAKKRGSIQYTSHLYPSKAGSLRIHKPFKVMHCQNLSKSNLLAY